MSTIADVLEGRAQWCVVEGDCLEVLPTLPDKSVAHVITDPPYEAAAHTLQRRVRNGKRTSTWGGQTINASSPALSFAPISEGERGSAAEQFARLSLRWVVTFCQVEAAMAWGDALKANGLAVRRIGVWVKPDAMPQFTGDRPGMGYESIVFAHAKGRSRWNGGGKVGVFAYNKGAPGGGSNDHETQKPLALMLELVELFTDPDEIILDPFAGSGTTGVACLRLGRRFIGLEKDARYSAIAQERLESEVRGLTLRDARAGQSSIFDLLDAWKGRA